MKITADLLFVLEYKSQLRSFPDHMEHIKAQPYKRAYVLRGIMVEVMNLQKHPDRLLKI